MPSGPPEARLPSHQRLHPEKVHSRSDHRTQAGFRGPPSSRSAREIDANLSEAPPAPHRAEKVSVNHSDEPEVQEAISCLLALIPQVTGHPPTRVAIMTVGDHIDAHVYLTGEGIRRVFGRGARTHEAFRRLSGAISGRIVSFRQACSSQLSRPRVTFRGPC
jgi:hypothetical protein